MTSSHGPAQDRRLLAPIWGRARPLLACGVVALLLAGCVGAGSESLGSSPAGQSALGPATSPGASGYVDSLASGAGGPSPGSAAPSNASQSAGPAATAGTGQPGAGATGGVKKNPLMVCVGPDQGPPCVQASDAAWVIAAESAVPGQSRPLIATATALATEACPAGVPAFACAAGTTPLAIVTFKRSDGSTLGRAFVYRTAAGQLAAELL